MILITIDSEYKGKNLDIRPSRERLLLSVRNNLCTSMEVAEELIVFKAFGKLFVKHEEYDRLPFMYPEARTFKDTLPLCLLDAYRNPFWH